MSDLKNIFYGDRVVQQAYLNDALIYQADSWTNTPSTMQLVSKSAVPLLRKTRGGANILFNSKNEVIVVDAQYTRSDGSTAIYNYRISKINSDTGTILYSSLSEQAGFNNRITAFGGGNYVDREYAYIDKNDIIHLVYYRTLGTSSIVNVYLLNITDTGTEFTTEVIKLDPSFALSVPYAVTFDDNYFYISILANNHYVVRAIDYGCKSYNEVITPTSWQIDSLFTTTDSVYLYGFSSNNNQVVQFNKYLWTAKIIYTTTFSYFTRMTGDNLNNLYFYATAWLSNDMSYRVDKYSTVNKTLTTILTSNSYGQFFHLSFDSKYNLYTTGTDYFSNISSSRRILSKYTPACQRIWYTDMFSDILSSSTLQIHDVFVDRNDSVYVLVPTNMTSQSYDFDYYIYKYISLEQVQSS